MTTGPAMSGREAVASPEERGQLARAGRRALRLARRTRRMVGAVARTLFRSDLAYTVAVPTPHGRRRRAMLLQLGAAFTDKPRSAEGWTFRDVQLEPPGFVFDHADGRELIVQLQAPNESKAFARTKSFAVSYRGPRELGPDEAFVRAVVADIEHGEAVLRGTEGFPGLLLGRSASAVTVYPNDMRVELRPTLACNHHCAFCNSVDRTIENVTQGIDDLRDGIAVWARMPVYRATVSCSSGTYIRTLAADLGRALGGGAHLRALRRTNVGGFTLRDAVALDVLSIADVRPPSDGMAQFGLVAIDDAVATLVAHGRVLALDVLGVTGSGPWPMCDASGALLAVYERHHGETAKPGVVLARPAAR